MLKITISSVAVVSFLAMLGLFWALGRRPAWRFRTVIYGWGLTVLWAAFWAVLLPLVLEPLSHSPALRGAFPGGTLVLGCLVFGWFWPALAVGIAALQRPKHANGPRRPDHRKPNERSQAGSNGPIH